MQPAYLMNETICESVIIPKRGPDASPSLHL